MSAAAEVDRRQFNSLAVIAKVDTEIHKVIVTKARLVNVLLQLNLRDLVGDVSQHDLAYQHHGLRNSRKGAYRGANVNTKLDIL